MTTTYKTEREALEQGVFYSGYTTSEEIGKILAEAETDEIDMQNPLCAALSPADEEQAKLIKDLTQRVKQYTFPNKDGVKVSIAVGRFRGGFDLWLINPKTGMGLRT
jgi:hypothetical protein